MPLRCILKIKKDSGESGISKLIDLEAHTDKRRGTYVWESHHENVIKVDEKAF